MSKSETVPSGTASFMRCNRHLLMPMLDLPDEFSAGEYRQECAQMGANDAGRVGALLASCESQGILEKTEKPYTRGSRFWRYTLTIAGRERLEEMRENTADGMPCCGRPPNFVNASDPDDPERPYLCECGAAHTRETIDEVFERW